MRTEGHYDKLIPRPISDSNGILGKNFLAKILVKLAHGLAKLWIRTSSQMKDLKIYNKSINNFVYMNK